MSKIKDLEKKLIDLDAARDSVKDALVNEKRAEAMRLNQEARKATEACKARLEDEHDVVGHPKADLLWSKAWERGHAYGLSEVEGVYSDLVELIK